MNDQITQGGPTTEKQRHLILDLTRGFALMGIALANFPEFALWTFLSTEEQTAMPTAGIDSVVRYLQFFLVEGKFYSIFSMLFGVGFALTLARHGRQFFIRRMLFLAVIGFLHLMFIWNGDILLLYATGGLLLTLLISLKDKVLLILAALFIIVIPVALDAIIEFGGIDFAAPFYETWWRVAHENGITEQNFASWLRDAHNYEQMFAFLQQGACERVWEFVEGHRLPKVLGLFILGYLIGKNKLYMRLEELPLQRVMLLSGVIGVPTSFIFAWSATQGHPWGLTIHSLLYAISVISMTLTLICLLCMAYLHRPLARVFRLLAAPGRMALSCYIGHSLVGIILFYGIGFGLGTTFGLVYIELVALLVFLLQVIICTLWFRYFHFGPLEWIWRLLTYGHYFPIVRDGVFKQSE